MFDNFISLGWFCGTAASMSKYGLRSWSGPFDWYFSDFPGVLACMENDFADFLDRNNIKMLDDNPKEFLDTKHGFYYNHEVTGCFDEDYESIYDKYARRIENFREMIKHKTCFIRVVRNNGELKYIQESKLYIKEIITKCNPQNEIIYIVSNKEIACENLRFPYFIINSRYSGASRKTLRSLFDENKELRQFFDENFDEAVRYRNLYFDLQQEYQRLQPKAVKYELISHIYETDLTEHILPQEIIIYGIGIVGKYLYQKIKKKCKVLFFVEIHSKENSYEGIPIISLDDFLEDECSDIPIVVTAYSYNEIRVRLTETGKGNILSLDDFLHQGEK